MAQWLRALTHRGPHPVPSTDVVAHNLLYLPGGLMHSSDQQALGTHMVHLHTCTLTYMQTNIQIK